MDNQKVEGGYDKKKRDWTIAICCTLKFKFKILLKIIWILFDNTTLTHTFSPLYYNYFY